ncbi:MAG: N-acetylneuraminate synthase family protein [Victivallales bacterium]|nr:N-acetylneuraminate synthase family protein [Victivallales bacterium]
MSFHYTNLFVLEMANNHMGDLEHGLDIIRACHSAIAPLDIRCAIKFQYRDLDTFIHPSSRGRADIKYVKRFEETRLPESAFLEMKAEAEKLGMLTACTPFDENSVGLVQKHKFHILKIASCSLTDWPLLDKIASVDLPVIASTAGADLEEIDKVVSFFEHRAKQLCLMHCVGSYPTPSNELEMNQIDLFKQRYPGIAVGFSTHEHPDDLGPVKIAVAKGATVLERHVGMATEKYPLNAYSSSPEQLHAWAAAAKASLEICGTTAGRRKISAKEAEDLRGLKRGVFASKKITPGEKISSDNTFLAIPNQPGQLLANDLSKYIEHTLKQPLAENAPLLLGNMDIKDHRERVLEIVKKLCTLLKVANIRLPNKLELELSHHYGLEQFDKFGCSMINCINREYCKKIIILLPGQENPCHKHKLKEETFHILHGDLTLTLGTETKVCSAGELVTVERDIPHSFSSDNGAIFEEVSTTHYKEDSYYNDSAIHDNTNRKTRMTFWGDWLEKEIK